MLSLSCFDFIFANSWGRLGKYEPVKFSTFLCEIFFFLAGMRLSIKDLATVIIHVMMFTLEQTHISCQDSTEHKTYRSDWWVVSAETFSFGLSVCEK